MSKEEKKRINLIKTDKIKNLFRQVKKYADAGSTANSLDEIEASELCCYKLLNEVKKVKSEMKY